MSDRQVILQTLEQIRRRLRLTRALHDITLILGMAAVALLLWRVPYVFSGRAPIVAAAVLAALLLWVSGAVLLVRGRMSGRSTLWAAAAVADAGAGLKDELKTAYWFLDQPSSSPWVSAQIGRAAQSARRVEPAALVPLRVDRTTLTGGIAALVLVVAAWLLPPFAPGSDAAPPVDVVAEADARQAQLLRELIPHTEDEATAAKLEQALRTLERKTATDAEKQRALAEAKEAVEQQNLQAASMREGLYKLSAKLSGNKALSEVAKALEEGDAAKAATMMQSMADARSAMKGKESGASDQREKEKDLDQLMKDAAQGDDKTAQGANASVAAKEAIDRLKQIAEKLEVQSKLKEAAQSLSHVQLAVAQRSQMAAGRFSRSQSQSSTPSPDSGQTNMPGGVMFRSAAVAQENRPSQQQEGSKTGAALGDSEADPVLGKKVTPLDVQLKREAVTGEQQEDAEGKPKNWYYTESKQQASVVDYQGVGARSSFALGQSSGPEGISIRHRQIVKDYFMTLREGSQR
ncbi:MAG TPA: hypothetical protein VEV20_07990 [Burkholderiales bacterium]|nr:hypothetical protein [Burkholderiales bacterium]